ncbi:hypothetical protein Tco_0641015 [Tanacetum coccineum]
MPAATKALIAAVAAALPSSPPPFPLTPLSSPLPQIPSPPLPVPSPPYHFNHHLSCCPTFDEASQATEFEVRESLVAAAARQARHALTSSVDYGFIDTVDASIRASKSRAITVVGVRDVDVLQRQRIRDEDRLMRHIQHEHDRFRELVRTAEAGPQDRPADAGSSC